MFTKTVEKALNEQIEAEMASSQYYLAMASWAETKGFNGVADFLYGQSDEERGHMLKLVKYINERGGQALVPAIKAQPKSFKSLTYVFEQLLAHEIEVSLLINELVAICMDERDFTTQNFLQWYVSEQIEEEALARTIMDKLRLIGNDKGGLYLFDTNEVDDEKYYSFLCRPASPLHISALPKELHDALKARVIINKDFATIDNIYDGDIQSLHNGKYIA